MSYQSQLHSGPDTPSRGARSGSAVEQTVTLDELRRGSADVVADPQRLEALYRLGVLDTQPDTVFERLTEVIRRSFGVRVARIHLLDDAQQWVYAGTDEGSTCSSTPVEQSACQYAIRQDHPLVIPDLTAQPEFGHAVIAGETMRFYAGMPLRTRDGQAVGTLCLVDPGPRESLTTAEVELLAHMAALVIETLELRDARSGAEDELRRALDQDAVTGLLSRRGLLLRLQRQLEAPPSEDERVVGLMAIHLQGVHGLTHAYGSAVTNELQRDIGERLRASLGADELLAHLGDSKFVVMSPVPEQPGTDTDSWLSARGRDLVTSLRSSALEVAGEDFQPEVGIGIARAPGDSIYAHELLVLADEAAWRSSEQRRHRIRWPDQDALASKRQRLSLDARLRRAVAEGALAVHYQPIVDLNANARVVGAEALARWPQGEGQAPIGPDVFIPMAEELGLMEALGRQVFTTSCQQLRRWQATPGEAEFWVSVNLAPVQLQDPNLARRFSDIAEAEGVAPSSIKLELTESAFDEGFEAAGQVIDDLAHAGFALALDDFGTGHSSLNRLINMPFDILKVDRSFVWDSPRGPGAAIVSTLSQLAGSLRLSSLGEGVETAEHEGFLRQCGYAYAQGYYYGKPVAASAFPMG